MASLPHDIVLDVLRRLAVKDLLRYRCVSKPFCSSIDDPDFVKFHLSHSLKRNTEPSLIFRSIERNSLFSVNFDPLITVRKLNYPILDDVKHTEILGSCNGLLALINLLKDEICLLNLSTRKSQLLPSSKIDLEFLQEASPQNLTLAYGLGHDPISDDYKLVRMVHYYGRGNGTFSSEVKVYSLRTNSWRKIQDFPFHLINNSYGVLASNALHWVASTKLTLDSQIVAAIDLKTEEYLVVELPDFLDNPLRKDVSAMGGSLCLIANYWSYTVVAEIWLMKEYGVKESWTKLISLKPYESELAFVSSLRPLAFPRNGDRVLLYINEEELVWYDMTAERVDKARISGVPSRFEAEMLAESLVPLNGNGAVNQ